MQSKLFTGFGRSPTPGTRSAGGFADSISNRQVGGIGMASLVVRDGPSIDTAQQLIDSGLEFRLTKEAGPNEKHYDVAAHLRGKICPVFRPAMRNICWLFCVARYAKHEVTTEVAREMTEQGLSLDTDFQVVVFSEQLLMQIAEGKLNNERLQVQRQIDNDPQQSALKTTFIDIIKWAYLQGAADVDFRLMRRSPMSQVAFSIDGKWVYPERFRIDSDLMERCLSLAFQLGDGAIQTGIEWQQEQQLRIYLSLPDNLGDVMLRWAALAGDDIYSVTCRIVRLSQGVALTLPQLGYLPDHMSAIQRAIRSDGGAVIFSGVVNSGKSTSLGAMVVCIPPTRKIITIEDPAEMVLPGAIANTVSRPLTGGKSEQLAAKLATLKRTGFNDLLLGEIRDSETGKAAQDVFESGQKLYTTVHGSAAFKIPDRLAGPQIGIPREALATPGNLRLLVYQALLPTNCKHCALPLTSLLTTGDAAEREYAAAYIARLQRLYRADLSRVTIRNPYGCDVCRRDGMPDLNGLKGRTSATEMLEPDEEFCHLVNKHDGLGMLHYLQRLRGDAPFDSESMTGKSAMDCAVYKMLTGSIDPREIEPRFSTFEQIELQNARRART